MVRAFFPSLCLYSPGSSVCGWLSCLQREGSPLSIHQPALVSLLSSLLTPPSLLTARLGNRGTGLTSRYLSPGLKSQLRKQRKEGGVPDVPRRGQGLSNGLGKAEVTLAGSDRSRELSVYPLPRQMPTWPRKSLAIGAAHKGSRDPARLWGENQGLQDHERPTVGKLWLRMVTWEERAGSYRSHQEAGSRRTQHCASADHSSPPLPNPQTCFRTLFSGTVWRFGPSSHIL